MYQKYKLFGFILVLALGLVSITGGCGGTDAGQSITVEGNSSAVIKVVTTNDILADWVKNVAADGVDLYTIIPPGDDGHSFRPTPRDVATIQDADVLFLVGHGYEAHWLDKLLSNVAMETGNIVYLSESVELIRFSGHGQDHKQGDGEVDQHFWQDPIAVISAVKEIADKLSDLDESRQPSIKNRAQIYVDNLLELDNWIRLEIDQIPNEKRFLITNHETMGYFANRYEFEVVARVIDGLSSSKDITPRDIVDIMNAVEEHQVDVIFSEPRMADKLAKMISGDTGVVISQLHGESLGSPGSDAGTYIGMMKANVNRIVEGLL